MKYKSWAYDALSKQGASVPMWPDEIKNLIGQDTTVLGYGRGRSYGDSCLNTKGTVIDTRWLSRIRSFDRNRGILEVESGVTLSSLLRLAIPEGWFLQVTPGTSKVTIGGAIANDVHGKNHHKVGSFGNSLIELKLMRSSGETLTCSANENAEMFAATIGGLGLTGLILTAKIQLQPIKTNEVLVSYKTFKNISEWYELSKQHSNSSYSVAWLDCVNQKKGEFRGIFMSGEHDETKNNLPYYPDVLTKTKYSVPFNFPDKVLNKYSISSFNSAYYFLGSRKNGKQISESICTFFYPLDAISNWNKIYGKNGFFQLQFVIPEDHLDEMNLLLKKISSGGQASFLSVLKLFGDIPPLGMLSFPRKGICLALDFSWQMGKTEKLIELLMDRIFELGGAVYPAKDRLLSKEQFQSSFPRYQEYMSNMDCKFMSDYGRRVFEL